ncbi:MAG TPA: hypothetical protein VJ859_15590, partial [Allosphingosinicella sp.]|nr:hypothetical protein [Allosphingosinicella sp.]
ESIGIPRGLITSSRVAHGNGSCAEIAFGGCTWLLIHGETLFFMMRPLAAASDASPAPLRLSVRLASGGINIGFVKRPGPQCDELLFLPMSLPNTRLQRQGSPERQA